GDAGLVLGERDRDPVEWSTAAIESILSELLHRYVPPAPRRPWMIARRLVGAALLGYLALGSNACARFRARDDAAASETIAPIDLDVDNHNWSDVVVSLNYGSRRTRLGTAAAARQTSFKIPASYVYARPVSLHAAPIGSRETFDSETFTVQAGQRVS